MHDRKLGPFEVSAIGLGCMNMSMGYGPRPEEEVSKTILNQALDHGYTFFDTAAMYGLGHNEELIGKFLSSRRNEFTLATKCGIDRDSEGNTELNGHPNVLKASCESSLKKLNTDVIDLYYLHRVDPNIPVEESIGAISRLVEQGKVQTIGMSEVCVETLKRGHATHPITAVQSEYSLWSRTPERGMLSACNEFGIAFVPFSPLARQFLTGKCIEPGHYSKGDIRLTNAKPRFTAENFAKNKKLLTPYRKIAEREGCTMAQLALGWLLAQGDNIIPIPGTKHMDYMIENAGAGDLLLNQSVVDELDQLINESTVAGRRYNDDLMSRTDSEKD